MLLLLLLLLVLLLLVLLLLLLLLVLLLLLPFLLLLLLLMAMVLLLLLLPLLLKPTRTSHIPIAARTWKAREKEGLRRLRSMNGRGKSTSRPSRRQVRSRDG